MTVVRVDFRQHAYEREMEREAEASYAQRTLEIAVGAALGEAAAQVGRPKKNSPRVVNNGDISQQDQDRFRLLYQHRELVWDVLEKQFRPEEKPLARRKALKYIEASLKPRSNGLGGGASISHCAAVEWLGRIAPTDLLLTDPPYSTDVDDVHAFARDWLPMALSNLKPSGRALVFIGAYADELAAYFSIALPKGWTWGVPHAWVYRNAIGPTPERDFVRNWQLVLSAIGPEAA